jgi:hypothetical protein
LACVSILKSGSAFFQSIRNSRYFARLFSGTLVCAQARVESQVSQRPVDVGGYHAAVVLRPYWATITW